MFVWQNLETIEKYNMLVLFLFQTFDFLFYTFFFELFFKTFDLLFHTFDFLL